ncbi:MAG: 50S ribosomal protein L4 [Phycisphaerae bacterium]|nr:50S ribosomal protein L4 [Phycisphaerae bacterium]
MVVPVLNQKGVEVGSLTIDEAALGGSVNASLLKQAYVRYHAGQRQGSSRTKNRTEVEGSTRKLYRQKGTGNARHGDRKANLMKGGGHGHSKKRVREDYRLDMPKKMRRKANRNALLAKLVDNEVRVVDSLELGSPKTKEFVTLLGALKIDRTALVALPSVAVNSRKAAANLGDVTLCQPGQLNCFDLLNHRYLIIAKSDLEAWLQGPWSQTGKDAKISPRGRAKTEIK